MEKFQALGAHISLPAFRSLTSAPLECTYRFKVFLYSNAAYSGKRAARGRIDVGPLHYEAVTVKLIANMQMKPHPVDIVHFCLYPRSSLTARPKDT
jgi:hypothetical protein